MNLPKSRIDSARYTTEYFEKHCGGADIFSTSPGSELPIRIKRAIDCASPRPNDLVLDIGCGRGELMAFCARAGSRIVSVDYASAAIEIAKTVRLDEGIGKETMLAQADARTLPIPNGCVDVAFMLDVVEHLSAEELALAFRDVARVLKKSGRLVVHTMPNTWYYRYGYPIHRLLMRAKGSNLPANPRDRWEYVDTHVNEQNPSSLARAMRQAGFKTKVWVTSSHESSAVPFGRPYEIAVRTPLLQNVVCNDIYAIGYINS